MAVPTARTDLSATIGTNSPAGSDTISGAAGIDEYLRALSAFIKQNYDDILLRATLASPTFTGTVVLPSTTSIGNVSSTEIGYLDGVTSAIQTQIDNLVVGGGTFQPLDSDLTAIAALTPTDNAVIIGNGSAWVAESGATLKTSLGLTIGTDVQAYNSNLATIAGFTPTDNNVIVGNGSAFVLESGATLRTSLGLAIGTNVQAYSAKLTDISNLAVTDSNIIVGNGTTWVAETGATARTSLGLGSVENTALSTWTGSANVTTLGTIGTGTWNATTISVAKGGTGATTLTGYVKGTGTTAFTASASVPVADISGTLTVAKGGTGATTLTGILKGNGTSAFTAATSNTDYLPGTDPSATGWVTATKGFKPGFNTTTHTAATGAVTINMDTAQSYVVTMSGNITPTFSNMVAGRVYRILFTATTGRTIAWPASFQWPYNTEPSVAAGTQDVCLVSWLYDGTNCWASFQVY